MLNPNTDPFSRHVARIQHQELLKGIEADWLYHHNHSGLLHRIIHQVKAAGRWIKSHTRSTTTEPCFDGS